MKQVNFETPTRKEQETILNYDNFDHIWTVYSDVPKHVRKLKDLVTDDHTEGINAQGAVTMIKGKLKADAYISMQKKHILSQEEKDQAIKRLSKYWRKPSK